MMLNMKRFFSLTFCCFLAATSIAVGQQNDRKFKIHTVAFYNLENLFDTINNPDKFDEASPMMELKSNRFDAYGKKISNMAKVVSDIGTEVSKNAPAIIGVSEIENREVLEDLVNDPQLIKLNYGIVHYDSPDARGIDVGLLYQKNLFKIVKTSSHELKIYDDKTRNRVYTRNQLLVSGLLEDELIHIIVNHWPSRSGGEERSRPKRVAAAKLTKRILDSLQVTDPYAKVLIMGDFNDDPTNESIKVVLNTKASKDSLNFTNLYNPMDNILKKGVGSIAFRDNWSLFDQIIMTASLVDNNFSTLKLFKAGVFNKPYLTNKRGRYAGYPFRSFSDGVFTGGYSDHYPVYVYLIKEIM
ncbi:Endonuclease/Exonuclease/phosphatase family protein [Flavobacteriaceae bacterium MAR_2010_188]|nr:Endonuclease/Exonuclease/phosphatase family protein [Flavobacteriaceae bacterium MAR_2010_188]